MGGLCAEGKFLNVVFPTFDLMMKVIKTTREAEAHRRRHVTARLYKARRGKTRRDKTRLGKSRPSKTRIAKAEREKTRRANTYEPRLDRP